METIEINTVIESIPPTIEADNPTRTTYLGRTIEYVKSDQGRLTISRIVRAGSVLMTAPFVLYGSIKANIVIIIPSAIAGATGFIGGKYISNRETTAAEPTQPTQTLALDPWMNATFPSPQTQAPLTVIISTSPYNETLPIDS